jgi:hypothetical protein
MEAMACKKREVGGVGMKAGMRLLWEQANALGHLGAARLGVLDDAHVCDLRRWRIS